MPALDPHPRHLTSVERRWLAVVLGLGVELITMLLPRARADSYEGFFETYYGGGVPYQFRTPIDVDAFFFAGPAAIEVGLMIVVAMLATAMLLRRDYATGLRRPGLIAAALLPASVALAVLLPGVNDGVPFRVLAGGYVGLAAALAVGATLAMLALARDAGAKTSRLLRG